MQYKDYISYLVSTIVSDSTKTKRYLKKTFSDAGITFENEQTLLEGTQELDFSGSVLDDQLVNCITKDPNAVSIYEEWEFTKDYKYSSVFTANNFSKLTSEISQIQKHIKNNTENNLYDDLFNPTIYELSDLSLIKFNLKFEAIHPLTEKELLLKYPVIIAIHKKYNIIELRFDTLKRVFMLDNSQTFYSDLIQNIRNYFQQKFNIEFNPIDLNFVIEKAKKQDEIKLVAQYMKLANGGCAQLEVGNNDEYVLPLIGELKSLMSEHQIALEKNPEIKEALEQFIYEKEEMSDYPWIEALWENEIKTRSFHVKFVFNYMNKGYCLLQHYFNGVLNGMERMNRVIEFIGENKADYPNSNQA